MASTHAGTAGAMLDGSDEALSSLSRYVFSSFTILRVVMVANGMVMVRVGEVSE